MHPQSYYYSVGFFSLKNKDCLDTGLGHSLFFTLQYIDVDSLAGLCVGLLLLFKCSNRQLDIDISKDVRARVVLLIKINGKVHLKPWAQILA